MADQANIVGKVSADTSSAVASMNALKRSVDATGAGFSGFAAKASSAIDGLAVGFAKFNLALGGVQKAFELAGGAVGLVKFSAEANLAEKQMKALGVSAYELSLSVGGTVDNLTLLKFGLKQLQGETRLTEAQLKLVLKAADNLGDQGFGDTMKIAEDLAKALKGGPTRALKEYNIEVSESAKGTAKINDLMEKFRTIAEEDILISNQLEAIDRVEAKWKNLLNNVKKMTGETFLALYDTFDALSDHIAMIDPQDDASRQHFASQRTEKTLAAARAKQAQIDAQMAAIKASPLPKPASEDTERKSGSRARSGGTVLYDASKGFERQMAEFDKFAAGMDQDSQDASDRTNAYAAHQAEAETLRIAHAFDGMAESVNAATEAVRELKEQELAATMEQLNAFMIVGTPAVVGFAEALMDGGNGAAALGRGLQQGLRMLAIDSAVKALYALGEGLLFSNPKQLAAAAKYSAAAVAAGVGSAAIGSIMGSAGSGASSAGASIGRGGSIGSSGGDSPIVINVQGYVGNEKELGRVLSSALNEAQRTGRARARSNERWA